MWLCVISCASCFSLLWTCVSGSNKDFLLLLLLKKMQYKISCEYAVRRCTKMYIGLFRWVSLTGFKNLHRIFLRHHWHLILDIALANQLAQLTCFTDYHVHNYVRTHGIFLSRSFITYMNPVMNPQSWLTCLGKSPYAKRIENIHFAFFLLWRQL